MLKRSLFIINAHHLGTRHNQLCLTDKTTGELKTVPIEDVAYIILEHPQSTFTQIALQHCVANNVAMVFCAANYMPSSILLNLEGNTLQSQRFKTQAKASLALHKQLWKQIVQAKIIAQAQCLKHHNAPQYFGLEQMAKKVLSGDSTFQESTAAKAYFPALFGTSFVRNRDMLGTNSALNYGYSILRAAVSRALVGSGLHPTLGIHHSNQYNAFCLADDIMEPLRPLVDNTVLQLSNQGLVVQELSSQVKSELIALLAADTVINNRKRPLMVALQEYSASLVAVYSGTAKNLKIPQPVFAHALPKT